ncbi:MAG: hypothetical protein IMY71_07170 [Bacteroidetes bacterium]|nr:hypothetical protein [Bacteroidota bacterium]
MMKTTWLVFLLLCSLTIVNAQQNKPIYKVESMACLTSKGIVPFWLRSNQYGSIPIDNISMSLIGSMHKDYDSTKTHLIDWKAAFEGRINVGNKSNFTLIEGFGKIRISIFEMKAGRSKDIMGLCDSILSSGSFDVSGNALGIPMVEISIPEFYNLPLFDNLFAFKGSYAHGWLGETPMMHDGIIYHRVTYYHQKSLYGRFGKPDWKLKLYGGFNHQVFWRNEKDYYGDLFTLSHFETYLYMIAGKPYGTINIPTSKIGNHLGSIDLGFEYTFRNARLFVYRQSFYDCGALYYLANIRDGLNGLSLVNTTNTNNGFKWERILIEFLYTKNQAGEFWSPYTPSGDENYYNNYQYAEGWSFQGVGIGTPFICSRTSIMKELPTDPNDYFINNRVIVIHFGFEGSIHNWDFILKTSYSLNYGTFGTSEVGHTLGKDRTLPMNGIFDETKQLSSYLEANKNLKGNLQFGFIVAFDVGSLYYDSFGFQLGISKSF